jgi:hypothetical protein
LSFPYWNYRLRTASTPGCSTSVSYCCFGKLGAQRPRATPWVALTSRGRRANPPLHHGLARIDRIEGVDADQAHAYSLAFESDFDGVAVDHAGHLGAGQACGGSWRVAGAGGAVCDGAVVGAGRRVDATRGVAVAAGRAVGAAVGVRVGSNPTASPAPRTAPRPSEQAQMMTRSPRMAEAALPARVRRLAMSRAQKRRARARADQRKARRRWMSCIADLVVDRDSDATEGGSEVRAGRQAEVRQVATYCDEAHEKSANHAGGRYANRPRDCTTSKLET